MDIQTKLQGEATEFLLGAGYEKDNLVKGYSYSWRPDADRFAQESAELVAFSTKPFNLRTACISVITGNLNGHLKDTLSRLRYLAAPVALHLTNEKAQLWELRRDLPREPFLEASRNKWRTAFQSRVQDLSPAKIVAAKRGETQLSFVDVGLTEWVEGIAESTLASLLELLIADALKMLPDGRRRDEGAEKAVLRLVCHLFACRVLEDKGIIPSSDTPVNALLFGSKQFPDIIDPTTLDFSPIGGGIANMVLHRLKERFAFQSLTTEMLSHSYENVVVTPALRRQLGIYYTPKPITEYILSRLPIESIDTKNISLCDPCCGSGSFLLAGFDRLSRLLPGTLTSSQRHNYLKARIVGMDVDAFACEVAKLSLVLTDPYNKNGWKVDPIKDVLTHEFKKRPSIIVTNPKFQEQKEGGTRREFSADVLQKLINVAQPGGLLGVVLPQSFLDSRVASETRKYVLDNCTLLEIAMFPGGLFHSNAETAVLLMRKNSKGEKHRPRPVIVRELRSMNLNSFLRASDSGKNRSFTRTYPVEISSWFEDEKSRFICSPLMDLWKKLESRFRTLGDYARLVAGLQVLRDDDTSVSDTQRNDKDSKYIDRLDVLRPFVLLTSHQLKKTRWIDYGPQLRRSASQEVFQGSKILINSNRNPGSAWRIVAAMAPVDLYFSDNFHGIAPKKDCPSLEVLTAVLNNPLVNAWFDSHCRKRKVVLDVLRRVPFPQFDSGLIQDITQLVKQIERISVSRWRRAEEGLFYDGVFEDGDTAELLSRIDNLVYDAYDLSQEDRQRVNRVMSAENRPT